MPGWRWKAPEHIFAGALVTRRATQSETSHNPPLPLGEGLGVRVFHNGLPSRNGAHIDTHPHPGPLPKGEGVRRTRGVLILLNVIAALCVARLAFAESFTGPLPDVDAPLADPVVAADATFSAQRVTAWEQDGIRGLLLEGDVIFKLGTYGFRGERVVARIDTQTRFRRRVYHLAVYFDDARTLHGAGRIQAEGPGLLVTASTTGSLLIDTPLLTPAPAVSDDALVDAAARRIAEHRERLAAAPAAAIEPTEPLVTPEIEKLRAERRAAIVEQQIARQIAQLPRRTDEKRGVPAPPPTPVAVDPTILPTKGVVQFSAERLWAEGEQNALALIGDVNVSYTDYSAGRVMTLKAQRMVIFAEGDVQGSLAGNQVDAAQVTGVYLEDNVIVTDGQYTVRAPRMFYDVKLNKAILLDAVMYTWDVKRQIPLYLRADTVRQESRTQFVAEDARLTMSEFGKPHVAIGADRLTLEQPAPEQGPDAVDRAAAEHMTVRVGDVPVFYWPYAAVENREIPLRRAGASYSENKGATIETTWNLFALAGRDAPPGVEMDLLLDLQGNHGAGIGLMTEYERPSFFGELQSYLLPADSGEDDLGGRVPLEQDNDTRGFFQLQHRHLLGGGWEMSLEAAYVSDETFLEEFFDDEADEEKTYETSIYLEKRMHDDPSVFSFLAKYDVNDFTPQLSTLLAPGYTVDKLPELAYTRTGTSLLGDRLTWFSDNRLSRMRIVGGEDAPMDRGFRAATSNLLFGIPRTVTFEEALDASGVPMDWVNRFDSRQELTLPSKLGPFNVTPYAVGRITAYDDDFEQFSADADEQYRLWGVIGTRASIDLHSTSSDVESQLLDVHRLRHVITPSVDAWAGASNIDHGDLPIYDYDVEAINADPGARFGLRNTLQTQRGGPGRWRSVDWIVLDTDFVFRDNDHDPDEPLARYFDYRPELTTGGDHFYTRLLWLVTDTFALSSELIYDLEENELAQFRIGGTMQHTPRFATFVDYDELPVFDSKLITYGFSYQLTAKYAVGFSQRIDLEDSSIHDINVSVERRLPRWRFLVTASIDDIDDETTVGFLLIPQGFGNSTRAARMLGAP